MDDEEDEDAWSLIWWLKMRVSVTGLAKSGLALPELRTLSSEQEKKSGKTKAILRWRGPKSRKDLFRVVNMSSLNLLTADGMQLSKW